MPKFKLNVHSLIRAALIAAIYATLTISMPFITYGPLQFRAAEALTLLPLLMPEAVIGVTVGCLIANLMSPFMVYDIVFGTIATLIAAVATYYLGHFLKGKKLFLKAILGSIPPILVNALILPLIWHFAESSNTSYIVNAALILATQSGTILLLGVPLVLFLDKYKYKIYLKN